MNDSTLCIGADIHKEDIVLRGVDKAHGHEVIERFRVTNSQLGAESAVKIIAAAATELGYVRIAIGWEATGMLWIPFHRSTLANLRPRTDLLQPQTHRQVQGQHRLARPEG